MQFLSQRAKMLFFICDVGMHSECSNLDQRLEHKIKILLISCPCPILLYHFPNLSQDKVTPSSDHWIILAPRNQNKVDGRTCKH